MPRRARLIAPDIPLHIIQRGNNRQDCFFEDADRQRYRSLLHEVAKDNACDVHAYVLMTNHVHLLLTCADSVGPSALMKRLGQRYTQYINRTHRRTGSLWEGRFRSCLVQAEAYLLACQRYIELNPVRAGMVARPEDYRWSSYRHNALGEDDERVTPHSVYLQLAPDPQTRRTTYREFVSSQIEPAQFDRIRSATRGNVALGDDDFARRLSSRLNRRVSRGRPGRPRTTESAK